ncbi:cupredoxin domain-containing protein [Halopiger djelfimassiliensis]|uniref:cupredoxin domain-containing protein n=1 Tax=Halopiger djelfimassiliensis TaxID=1293047 RepID=UPI000677C540|nr:plastocyanin/azurin family copper-binding protein [Halopiger djelfimassiliensis]
MRETDPTTRRTVLKLTGAVSATALVAGCGGNGGGDGDGGTEEENGAPEGGDGEADTSEWEGVSEIELGGETSAWQGQSPSQIEGEDNPTLVLFEGESYEITWENIDGARHNLEIRDENEEVVDDYSTELMDQQGETQTLEIDEVTSEMARYVCQPHEGTMNGPIQVESGGGGGGDGNETDGNETEE